MRVYCLLLVVAIAAISVQLAYGQEVSDLVECFRCLGNDTSCSGTCRGKYCYKIEGSSAGSMYVKRGCLNRLDSLSSVNKCARKDTGVELVSELMCICSSPKCNSSSMYTYSFLLLISSCLYILNSFM